MSRDKNNKFRLFMLAKEFAKNLKLKSRNDWFILSKSKALPEDIPADPSKYYKEEWLGWGDFLGNNNISMKDKNFRPFQAAKEFFINLGVKSETEWREWQKNNKRPDDIPANPGKAYQTYWISWADFLGTNNIQNQKREFKSFEDAHVIAKGLGLKGIDGWREWCKKFRPSDIPSNPDSYYKEDWRGWGHFLGTNMISTNCRTFKSFDEARILARKLKLAGQDEWREWSKKDRPEDIHCSPDKYYKDEWVSWGDFLGTSNVSPKHRVYLSFEEAKTYVKALKLNGKEGWVEWCKNPNKPMNIPASPSRTYQDEWKSWGDWLGVHNVWTTKAVIGVLQSLIPLVFTLTQAEVLSIMKQMGLNVVGNSNSHSAALINEFIAAAKSPNKYVLIEDIAKKIQSGIYETTDNEELTNDVVGEACIEVV